MVTIELDQEKLEFLEQRKQLLLEQARILCEAYDAGTLKKLLADLRASNTAYSHQSHPSQFQFRGVLEPAAERSGR